MEMIGIGTGAPGCVVFIVDRSGSMGRRAKGPGNGTLADMAAALVNAAIIKLALQSTYALGLIFHYFDIGVFGYGFVPELGTDSAATALSGNLAGVAVCDLPTLAENPLRVEKSETDPHSAVPVWLNSAHEGRTPMCQAFNEIGGHLMQWARAHMNSPPPVVVNISDGLVTDSPYGGASLETWLDRLSAIRTASGVVKVFDVILSPATERPLLRPAVTGGLMLPGWTIAQVASMLPPAEIEVSTWASLSVLGPEADYTAPGFVRRAELADDGILQ